MNLSHCFPPPFPTLLIFYQISSSRLFHVALSTFYLLSLGDLVYLSMSTLYAFKVPMKCLNDEITSFCPRQFQFLGTKFTSEQNSCRMNSMVNQRAIILAIQVTCGALSTTNENQNLVKSRATAVS